MAADDLAVRRLLHEMADKLETIRPAEPITTIGRHALLQATTMDPPLLHALRARAPEITGQQIRRAYATVLRQAAGPRPSRIVGRPVSLEDCAADYRDTAAQDAAARAARTQAAETRMSATEGFTHRRPS